MAAPHGYKLADFGGEIEEVCNRAGKPLFKAVTISWTTPQLWKRDVPAPTHLAEHAPGHLYALVRDHHKAKTRENIVYIGLTNDLDHRFANHHKAEYLRRMRGQTFLSIGNLDFCGYRTAIQKSKAAIEEIEHLLIWALSPSYNERKMYSMPGVGTKPSRAWHIQCGGHRFAGRMPREIVYPWMLLKPGRDRSKKG